MGRNTEAMCRLCRAESEKLFLKGKRCLTDKCAIERKGYPPGEKKKRRRFKDSNYKLQLREKQKVKRFYGIRETQIRNYFKKSAQRKGITGENLLTSFELRLDNVLYRMNFAYSRAHARQMICHGHVLVNGKKVDIPSYRCKENDKISFKEKFITKEVQKSIFEDFKNVVEVPEWLVVDPEKKSGVVNRLPNRGDVSIDVEEHLIVELFSK
jgi:small subunit ribosomal protein S4